MNVAVTVTNTSLDLLSLDLLRLSRGNARPPVNPVDAVNADASGKGLARRDQESQSQNQGQSLNSLVRVQATLSPSEELAVFATTGLDADGATALPLPPVDNPPGVVKTTLANLEAFRAAQAEKALLEVQQQTDVLTANAAALDAQAGKSGVQAFAAYLYARNNDIVFANAPLAQIAA